MARGTYQQVQEKLQEFGIDDYQVVDHPAAETTAEADAYIAGRQGVRTKSMFLRDKKGRRFYLLVMDDQKRLDFKEFEALTGTKRLSMAHPQDIAEQLGLAPGIISPFGLVNNDAHNVHVYFDRAIVDEPIQTFHPNENTHTIFIKTEDLFKFIEAAGYQYEILDL